MEHTDKDTSRLEAFSDGVFAIAITLLGLELKIPSHAQSDQAGLGHALLEQWEVYASFITSFFIILVIWKSHHQVFNLIHKMNAPVFFANGALLCCVTVIPFTTNIVADYFETSHRITATMLYSLVSFPVGFSFVALLRIILHYNDVRRRGVEVKRVKAWLRRMWFTSSFFIAAFLFVFVAPSFTLLIIFGAALYWSLAKTY